MLFKMSLSRVQEYSFNMRLALVLTLLSLLTSCTTFIPGIDRVQFSDSSARVGPLITVDEQYPANESEAVSATAEVKPITEPETNFSEPIGQLKSGQKMATGTDEISTIQTTEVNEIAPSKAIEPKNNPEFESLSAISPEAEKPKDSMEIAIEYGAVTGKVVLIGDEQQLLSPTGTMITLTPQMLVDEAQGRPSQVHLIDMEDKTYQPRYSTIHAGDQVVFVNKDDIQHNVFSSSGNNGFDLGTYGAGLKRAVTLKEPGIVKIYCNIHPEMATFVAVGGQGLSVRADDQGRYQIDEVLPGTYEVTIWNIRGETKRIVAIKADETIELVDRIDTTAFKVEPHKNKFGGNYSKNSTLFEDEFY
jgi:plastocyanin